MSGNFTVTRAYIYIAGNIIDPTQNNTNESVLYANNNAAFNASTGHQHTGATGDAPLIGASGINLAGNYAWTGNHSFSAPGTFTLNNGGTLNGSVTFAQNLVFNSGTAFSGTFDHANTAPRTWTMPDASGTVVLQNTTNVGPLPPIGSIIPFYDFNALVTFDTNYYRYCNGAVLAYASSPLNGQTLPDLSGRYLVGFGTDGGGNIGTALWATAAVGNASNQINIAHTHDHDHFHLESGSHTHGPGTLQFLVATTTTPSGAGNRFQMYDSGGSAITIMSYGTDLGGSGVSIMEQGDSTQRSYYTSTGSGVTASTVITTASPNTNTTTSALSSTQSIQPTSIRVRFIMRVL